MRRLKVRLGFELLYNENEQVLKEAGTFELSKELQVM